MDPLARAAWSAGRPGSGHAVDAACIAPWVSLEFDPQGWVYTCCANQLYPLGRIGDERLADLWAGPRARVLREAVGRWDLSVGCGSCRWHLEHGRMDTDAAVYDRYRFTDPEPPGPASITFALSNHCNLGCVMCNPELSSTLRHTAGLAPIVSRYDDQFFEDLAPMLPGLQYAKFLGGEPFLIRDHDRVWQLMDEVGGPDRMQVTTNATIWTDRVEWLLDRFSVDVTISIDAATAATYERIRVGSKFATVMRNVDRFAERCRTAGTELRFCFCLMADNWSELPGFLRWAEVHAAPVSVNVVSDRGLALHDLPLDQLEEIAAAWAEDERRLSGSIERNADVWATQRAQLDAVILERRRGVGAAPRQAQPARGDALRHGAPMNERSDVATERERLRNWSGSNEVSELELDADERIATVRADHRRLGIDVSLVGTTVDALLERIRATDGRDAWLLGTETVNGLFVRTFALAATVPERGVQGSIVRVVSVPTDAGWTMLVAEDRMHERSDATPVAISRNPGLSGSANDPEG